ncbi:MAG: methionyl-tRNA formyltransferase [Porphyromonas sp.]|nr:methionyl-tRNA formyltransferase [Porphyromonas sp.]
MSKAKELRLVYMATADFALPSLQRLVEEGYQVCAVVTMPDKPAGRGMKLQESKIKQYAVSRGIEVLQPVKLRDEGFVNRLRELHPDLGLVVAFRMLPEVVWQLPRYGTVNLHGSLLPRYRGAAPIHWAVMNGDTETGVSTFRLKHELDTGDILLQATTPITPEDTTGSVHDRLMYIGAELLVQTVELFAEGEPESKSQEQYEAAPSHAPKLTKENTELDWTRPAVELVNFVRGLNPYPTAWANIQFPGQDMPSVCKLHEVEAIELAERHIGLPVGTLLIEGRKHLEVVCGAGVLRLKRLQLPGKKAMTAVDLINGLH